LLISFRSPVPFPFVFTVSLWLGVWIGRTGRDFDDEVLGAVDWRFVELDISGEEDPAVRFDFKAIRLLAELVVAVPEEDAFDRLGLMLVVGPVVDVGLRSECPEMMERRFWPVVGLVGRLAVVGGRGESVDEVRCRVEGLCPVASSFWLVDPVCVLEETGDPFFLNLEDSPIPNPGAPEVLENDRLSFPLIFAPTYPVARS
jgi:hypothetical protein